MKPNILIITVLTIVSLCFLTGCSEESYDLTIRENNMEHLFSVEDDKVIKPVRILDFSNNYTHFGIIKNHANYENCVVVFNEKQIESNSLPEDFIDLDSIDFDLYSLVVWQLFFPEDGYRVVDQRIVCNSEGKPTLCVKVQKPRWAAQYPDGRFYAALYPKLKTSELDLFVWLLKATENIEAD